MSSLSFCKRGGQEGILTSNSELQKMSNSLKSEYLDTVIPIPQLTMSLQKLRIKQEHDCDARVGYWENKNNGSHGWCCYHCGTVIQWG